MSKLKFNDLKLIVRGKMKVMSQRELFRALWLLFGRSKELESSVKQTYDALKLLLPPNEFISFFFYQIFEL